MKKMITLATAGMFLLSLQGAWAEREVAPPAVPPMLEGRKPLATPETKEPTAPPKAGEVKAKPTGAKPREKPRQLPKPSRKPPVPRRQESPQSCQEEGVQGHHQDQEAGR